ncbi:hypothetical protein J5839_05990 [Methanosarcinaceae archaeon]|nr:hypothetical protein [Methanosarcinaceae archaeon]MBQ3620821.1 hypothetical protein [Methanosarcinaceae archaeon]
MIDRNQLQIQNWTHIEAVYSPSGSKSKSQKIRHVEDIITNRDKPDLGTWDEFANLRIFGRNAGKELAFIVRPDNKIIALLNPSDFPHYSKDYFHVKPEVEYIKICTENDCHGHSGGFVQEYGFSINTPQVPEIYITPPKGWKVSPDLKATIENEFSNDFLNFDVAYEELNGKLHFFCTSTDIFDKYRKKFHMDGYKYRISYAYKIQVSETTLLCVVLYALVPIISVLVSWKYQNIAVVAAYLSTIALYFNQSEKGIYTPICPDWYFLYFIVTFIILSAIYTFK